MNVMQAVKQIERSGRRFYIEMATRATNPGVRNIFRRLAEDEAAMLAELERLTPTLPQLATRDSRALDPTDNVYERLRAREDELVIADDVAAYALARQAEEEVVNLIEAAITRENRPEVRSLLKRLLAIERRELEEVEHLWAFANAPNENLEWGEFSNLKEFHNYGRNLG